MSDEITAAAAESAAERTLGGIGTRVLFEDDKVRIWELELAPGARSDAHRHELDYYLIQIAGDRIAVEPEPDSRGEYREYFAADVVPGVVVPMRRGGVETAVNVGEQRYHEIIVELKDR
ncbi:hypothetical protein [Embleya scabrispora]|uniref:hypothetical protein n=1 Tax=Embleya scabrispora TaxID=159449 RepID=UPI00036601F5|nr:hypothetical protein [Embleya scabrispora]MYS87471.1 hypothetical protein [Streptomyces sp. SID5474]